MSSTTTASPISTTLPAMPSPTFTSTGPRPVSRRPRGRRILPDRGCGQGDGLAEGASEIGYALREPAEEDVTEEGESESEEDSELRFGRLQQAEAPHEVHEDQQRQDGGQREDGACGFAELHWTLTDSRSSKGKPDDRVPSLSLSVPGAGADAKEKRLVEARRRNTPNASANWNAKSDLQARKSSWQKAGQVADF